jgi:hypothetical protein
MLGVDVGQGTGTEEVLGTFEVVGALGALDDMPLEGKKRVGLFGQG